MCSTICLKEMMKKGEEFMRALHAHMKMVVRALRGGSLCVWL